MWKDTKDTSGDSSKQDFLEENEGTHCHREGSNDVFVPTIPQTATPTRPPALPSNHSATRRGPQQEVPSVQVDFQPPVGNGNEEEIIDNFFRVV